MRTPHDRRPLATTLLLATLGLGVAACEASLDEDGAELDVDQDAFGDDG